MQSRIAWLKYCAHCCCCCDDVVLVLLFFFTDGRAGWDESCCCYWRKGWQKSCYWRRFWLLRRLPNIKHTVQALTFCNAMRSNRVSAVCSPCCVRVCARCAGVYCLLLWGLFVLLLFSSPAPATARPPPQSTITRCAARLLQHISILLVLGWRRSRN